MKIKQTHGFQAGGFSQHLSPQLTKEQITERLGFASIGVSGDGKCTEQWHFTVDGKPAAIWDYYGRRWTSSGPRALFVALFGEELVDPAGQ